MNDYLISIIIPVYKVEKYLRRCVDSVLDQTYQNIEVILVDDGSPDNCPAICDEYAARDSRVRVIHKENGGVSSARNAGIGAASGSYIGFVDSDDWVEPDMYKVLLQMLQDTGADIAEIEYFIEEENSPIVVRTADLPVDNCVFSSKMAVKYLCYGRTVNPYVWAKLVRKELFETISFPEEITIGEDKLVTIELFNNCKAFVHKKYRGYHYVQRGNSAMHTRLDWLKEGLNKDNTYYKKLLQALPNEPCYADKVWIDYDIGVAFYLAKERELTKENYKRLKKHMLPHISLKVLRLMSKKNLLWLSAFLLGRIPYIVGRYLRDAVR